jgi:tetratricopeptide (TPR) repeat protein
MGPRLSKREHAPGRMVYRHGMTFLLAVLLLVALPADGHAGEEPAPVPAQATPGAEAPATPAAGNGGRAESSAPQAPDAESAERLPEATAPPKPAVSRQQLEILAQDTRLEAYQQFRDLYEAQRFDEALPYAERVVEMSEQSADRDHELPIAYNNLGATQFQLGDYDGAGASYQKSLELLESTQGISSRRLVVPLAGLGAAYAARQDHQAAAELYDRAIAVSRRADGLFNLEQIPLLRQAADSRYAINDFQGAEHERLYAVKIAEQNYGYGDARTLPPLLEMAGFYEGLRQFPAARMMYLRAHEVARKESEGYTPGAVKALNGIARTHRLQYTMDPDTLESQQPTRDEFTGEVVPKVQREMRTPSLSADRTGLKAAQTALEMLRSTPNPPGDLMTQTLIELGDWFQTTSRPALAMPHYAEASGILDAEVARNPLAGHPLKAPRMVFYRPPASARRGPNTLPGQYVIRKTVFSFLVTETGLPLDITVVSTDMNEDQLGLSRRALSKAIYSPRFSEGRAVSTAGATFTAEWYEESVPPPTPAATQTTAAPASGESSDGGR